jgi:methyl-accepting chemotaxis protein
MLRNLNIRQRLLAVYVLFALMILVIGGFGLYAARSNNEAFQQYTFRVTQSGQWASQLRLDLMALQRYEKDLVIAVDDAAQRKKHADQWEGHFQRALKAFGELERRIVDPAVLKDVATAKAGLVSYHDAVAKELPQLDGKTVADAKAALQEGQKGFVTADEILAKANELVAERTQQIQGRFQAGYQTVLTVSSSLIVLAVVAMVLLGRAVSASIVEPLQAAERFAGRVRDGDLTGDLGVRGSDEAASLSQALVDMQGSLQKIVGNVRQAADSIQVASSEVASGNQDLSHRTEQTAASLQQTASAMNDLTTTVNQTADSARTAAQLAGSASTTAERGGAVVSEVVSTMERINHSSRRISDIIGTIDGIAFQTNILALNAAVEAARAGEAGRGFAVVAAEVRNLAQRSAEAAREIKSLIGASVESVDAGTRLVADAGTTMGEIVSAVQRVADIIGEISAAAGEQSSGIGNVNTSVVQLDQATQQNAALVEESAAAAHSLREQAQKLAEVVSTFRLPGGSSMMAYRPPAPAMTPSSASKTAPKPGLKPGMKKPRPTSAPAAVAASTPRPAPSPAPAPAPAADGDWETF